MTLPVSADVTIHRVPHFACSHRALEQQQAMMTITTAPFTSSLGAIAIQCPNVLEKVSVQYQYQPLLLFMVILPI